MLSGMNLITQYKSHVALIVVYARIEMPNQKSLFCVGAVLYITINLLNAELNLICHLLALLGAHRILHVSRIRVKEGSPVIPS
jgi:uncharacterized membrane protein